MSCTDLNCRSRRETSIREANVNSRATNSRLRRERNACARRAHRHARTVNCRLFFCKSLQSSFSLSQVLAFTIFTPKKYAAAVVEDRNWECKRDCGSAYSMTSFRAASVMFGAALSWQDWESNSVVPSRCPTSLRQHVTKSLPLRMSIFLSQVPAFTIFTPKKQHFLDIICIGSVRVDSPDG